MSEPPSTEGVLNVSVEQQASWVRNFNPLVPGARWPTMAGIYEPLLVWSSVRGEHVPWLATGYRWIDPTTLELTLRDGVLWSDGAPFTARDVAFTFDLLQRLPATDQGAVWRFLSAVEATGPQRVTVRFARPYTPGLDPIARQPIVPEHIWKEVADPLRFMNPDPVATGPFTEVRLFRNQVYELGRNPRYWMPDAPKVEALRFLAFPGNDQANLALISGRIDWSGNFVPAIERTFVARDEAHNAYWFPLVGTEVFLYPNTTRPPFDDVRVRRALSHAIDRPLLVEVASYGYTRPADATGLSDAFASYRDPQVAADAWVTYDPVIAAALLDEAGIRLGPEGLRILPDGTVFEAEIAVVSGWSDWVRAAMVISRGLGAIGIKSSVRTLDFSPWLEAVQRGQFALAIGWSSESSSPYEFYRWLMSPETVVPIGEAAAGNWHRFGNADAEATLRALERTVDRDERRRLTVELQRLFVKHAPAVPLFPNPSWGVVSTRRFVGFPSAADPYAQLSPNPMPECLLVLTRIRPRTAQDGP